MKSSGGSSTDFKIGDHVIEKNDRRWEGVIIGVDERYISSFGGGTFVKCYCVTFSQHTTDQSHTRYGYELELTKKGIIKRFFDGL